MSGPKHAHPDTPITNKIIDDADAYPETRVVFLINNLANKCREFERRLALAEGAAPQDDVPLRCEVVSGAIMFTVGAKVLAHATNICPAHYDAENDRGMYKVVDSAAFAKDVARAMNHESEDGCTPLTQMMDSVIAQAIDEGAEGVEEVSDAGPAEGHK